MCDTKSEKFVYILAGWLLSRGISWTLAVMGFVFGFILGNCLNLYSNIMG